MSESGGLPVWDLTRLYATPEDALQDSWGDSERVMQDLCKKASAITENTPYLTFKMLLEELNVVANKVDSARAYSFLYFSQDMTREGSGAFFQNMSEKLVGIDAMSSTVYAYLSLCDVDYLQGAIDNPDFAMYHVWFNRLLAAQKHTLSPEEEAQWVERSIVASGAWRRLAQETLGKVEVLCDEKTVSLNSAMNFLRDSKEGVRQQALSGIVSALQSSSSVMSTAFNAIVKDTAIFSQWRSYPDVDSYMHLVNEVSSDWVDELRRCVVGSYSRTSHELMRVRASVLGQKTLEAHNVSAPMSGSEKDIPWHDSLDWVLGAYDEFDPSMGALLRTMLDEGRLDMAIRKGKEGGAFCYMTPEGPYVLTNYHSRARDFLILAHELGHAIHGFLSADVPNITRRTSLILCEVASLFSEKLCMNYAMRQASPEERRALLLSYVSDQIFCIQGSISYDQFEKNMHVKRRSTELTGDVLCQAWLDARGSFFGDNVHLPEEYGVLWSGIPHFFHTPFYVYSYAFSGLIMHSLYRQKEQEGFVDKYKAFLQKGGRMTFDGLRELFGLNNNPNDFFKDALTSLYDDVDAMKRAVHERS